MASTLFRGGTVIDGSGGPPRQRTSVLVEDERIAAVGPDEAVAARTAADADIVDLAGRSILPGLIDLHVHSSFPSEMPVYLSHGVTSIRYAGIDLAAWRAISARVAADDPPGPRLFNLGPMLDRAPASWPKWSQPIDSPEDAASTAAHLIDDEGADGLIAVQQIRPPHLRAIVETAHERGKPVAGQLWWTDAAEAGEIGIDQLDNTSRIVASTEYRGERLFDYRSVSERMTLLTNVWLTVDWDETDRMIEAMVRRGVAYGPTFVVFEQQANVHPETLEGDPAFRTAYGDEETTAWAAFLDVILNVWTDDDRDRFRRSLDARREWLRRFHVAGGQLVVGTDMQYGGIAIGRELVILEEAGLTPVEAITASTGAAARVMRRPDIGVLEQGRLADLVVVDGDPSADLRALRDIRAVLRGGRLVSGSLP